jgi:hypothetical protein
MSSKSLAMGLILGLVIGLPIGYFLPQALQNINNQQQTQSTPNPYAGYTQFRVSISDVLTYQTFGEYKYYFSYYPNVLFNGVEGGGHLMIVRENVIGGTEFNLTIGVSQNYLGIVFTITEVHPEYCIIMAKLSS